MRKNLLVYIMLSLILVYVLLISINSVEAAIPPFAKAMPAVLDNSVEPSLQLYQCFGYEQDWGTYPYGPSKENIKKNFKSKKWIYIREDWNFSSGSVLIVRWCFDYPKDAILFPEEGTVMNLFPGWGDVADVGDKTCWDSPSGVLFAKGKILVSIHVRTRSMNDKQKKEYTMRIAKCIEKKL